MNQKYEWLNIQIDRMQAERSILPRAANGEYMPGIEDIAMLQMAAQMKALRPGAGSPRPDFLTDLRARMLAVVED